MKIPEVKWDESTIKDVAAFQNGHAFYNDGYSGNTENGYFVIDLFNISEDGKLRFGNRDKYVSKSTAHKYNKFILNKGDLVLAMTDMTQSLGILGKCAIIDKNDNYILNQRIGRIVPNDKICAKYLHCYINSPLFLKPLYSLAKGAVQKYVNTDDIKNSKILLPPLNTQNKIAAILSAYDDLIENNLRRIKILEEMAQNLYREWFVRFRFPGHEKVKMVDSKLGKIPEGWEIKDATDAILINPVTRIPKQTEKIYVGMEGLSNNSMLISVTEYRHGNSGAKYKNRDTLFARITPCLENGKTGFVQFLPSDEEIALGSTEFIVLRSRTLCPEYVYLTARTESFRQNAIKSMSGASGRQRVQYECFRKYLFAHPDVETLSKFSSLTSPVFRYIYLLSKQNDNLRSTRDLLLPKLISGEIDVSDKEIKVEEVA